MEARMPHPIVTIPGAMQAMQNLSKAAGSTGLDASIHHLVHLRASQINGCSFCVEMHAREMQQDGAPLEKVATVAAWREAPYFSDAERAALELAEEMTRLSDRGEIVPDELWARLTTHFDEAQLGALIVSIATINVWNRVNATIRQVAGAWAG
jgi:AhpD family alkylhydroperoxidase